MKGKLLKFLYLVLSFTVLFSCAGCKETDVDTSSAIFTAESEIFEIEEKPEKENDKNISSDISKPIESQKPISSDPVIQSSAPTSSAPISSASPHSESSEPMIPESVQRKLGFNIKPFKLKTYTGKTTADPHVFQDDDGKFYMYVTGLDVYSATDLKGMWDYHGTAARVSGRTGYWAPCIYKENGVYYLYFSCAAAGDAYEQRLYVMKSSSPLGPFSDPKPLYNDDKFRIDPHVVKTNEGLFIFYSRNESRGAFIGTRIAVDKLSDPYTVENNPADILLPSEAEEVSAWKSDRRWYTLEGAFYVEKDGWRYLMYSANDYESEDYHVNYAVARIDSGNFSEVKYVKHKKDGEFDPLMYKSDYEEGTGHHSVVQIGGEYYMIYHARDYDYPSHLNPGNARTARMCKLHFQDGIITAESIN